MLALSLSSICNGTDVLNRTSSAPSPVLHYVLDKGQCFNLESFVCNVFTYFQVRERKVENG